LRSDKSITWVILGIGLVIIFAALGNVFGQGLTEQAFQGETGTTITANGTGGTVSGVATPNFQTNIMGILTNTKVLGMIILFTIAVFAIALLSGSNAK